MLLSHQRRSIDHISTYNLGHRTTEEFNSFTVGIVFRWRTERSLPPHLIKDSRIVYGYLWPNLYYQIEEDLIVCTLSRGSIVTGVTTSGTTTPVDPLSSPEELHKVPLPPDPLPELPGLPDMFKFNRRVETVCQRVKQHNQQLREGPSTPRQHLAVLLAHIRSGENLDEVAFTEGNITYCQLQRIDQLSDPHLYTEASLLEDTNYQPPCYQDTQSEGEGAEEEEVVEEHPLPIPGLSETHLEILHSEQSS